MPREGGSDRLLLSTDHPFQRPTRSDIDGFLRSLPTDEAREQFAASNARRLFRIDA